MYTTHCNVTQVGGENAEVDCEPQYAEVTVLAKQPGRRPHSTGASSSTAVYADIDHTLNKSLRVASARANNRHKARR